MLHMETTGKTKAPRYNVHIYLESNPNPNSLKFVTNLILLPEGESFDFPDAESAVHAPLAQELFGIEYVERVFYMNNFITVTKSEAVEWIEIQDKIKQHIKQYLEEGKPILVNDAMANGSAINENDSETVKKIKGILDEYIRPAVEQDGGAISFHSFDDGVVKVLLQGSCSGCPSSTITLKAGIENLLKTMLPNEVKEVEAEGV
jgi:NFU1 iron-sulfur cluster scaffold homolog, mitochondrial